MKLCKDCKHIVYVPYLNFLPNWVDKSLAKCNSPRAFTRIDFVTGEPKRYTEWCSSQRIGEWKDDRSCGEAGNWFESK